MKFVVVRLYYVLGLVILYLKLFEGKKKLPPHEAIKELFKDNQLIKEFSLLGYEIRISKGLEFNLVEKLLKEGWVPLPERGDAWWQWRFKRKLKS